MKKILVTYKIPGGIVWKILPDENGNYLVVESRDSEKRRTMFSVINLLKNDFQCTFDSLPKPWWVGLKAVGYEKAVVQIYKESNNPEMKGLYVIDLLNGKLLWHNDEKLFYTFENKEMMQVVMEKNDLVLLQTVLAESGKIVKETAMEEWKENSVISTVSIFPLLYSEENTYYKTMKDFIEQHYQYRCVGPLEYLEHKNNIFISFYILENDTLINILLVIDDEGNCLLHDRLMEGAAGIGMSSFFISNNKLIYIKNKTSIALAELI